MLWLVIHQSTFVLALHAHPAIHKEETGLGLFDLPTTIQLRSSSPCTPQVVWQPSLAPLISVDDEHRVNPARPRSDHPSARSRTRRLVATSAVPTQLIDHQLATALVSDCLDATNLWTPISRIPTKVTPATSTGVA